MKLFASSLALAVTLLASAVAQGAIITYQGAMNGPAEAPPNASPGTGLGTIIIDDTAMTMSLSMSFSDLLGETTMGHLHCCTAAPLSSTAPVAVPFNDIALGVHAGTYSHVFNLADAASYNPAFITAHGATVDLARAFLIDGIASDQSYLNIHTSDFPGGEIRGFLVAVPEPASWWLLGAGLAGLGACARRTRR